MNLDGSAGFTKDTVKALKMFIKAAEDDFPDAMVNAGEIMLRK